MISGGRSGVISGLDGPGLMSGLGGLGVVSGFGGCGVVSGFGGFGEVSGFGSGVVSGGVAASMMGLRDPFPRCRCILFS